MLDATDTKNSQLVVPRGSVPARNTTRMRSVGGLAIRRATAADGPDIAALVERCSGLDANSRYAYVLLCDEFGDGCVIARDATGRLLGFVTGFVRPRDPRRLFLWQIGVDPDHRGRGLAHSLIRRFVEFARTAKTEALELTVAPENEASLALFRTFARGIGAEMIRIGSYPGSWLGADHADENRYLIDVRHIGSHA